jgi:hypothetical protein
MKFRTELNKYKAPQVIDYSKKILCIGSCFAENLHTHLLSQKFETFLNPCGITYNPSSILKSMKYALEILPIDINDIVEYRGVFSHPDFHSSFSATSKNEVSDNIKAHLTSFKVFRKPDVVILSLGSAFAYCDVVSGGIVNNCHKMPASNFEKHLMTVESVVECLNELVALLKKTNPNVEIIGTVSPVRHLRDGLVNNNRSKSILNVALHSCIPIFYFPSYELLLDDLRDYRFYARDLVHPSEEAIEYILSFFEGQFFSTAEADLRKQILQIQRDLQHRAFLPNSDDHQSFLKRLIKKMERIQKENSVNFSKELEVTKSKLI